MSDGSNSQRIGCGTVLFLLCVVIFFLGQLGASTVGR